MSKKCFSHFLKSSLLVENKKTFYMVSELDFSNSFSIHVCCIISSKHNGDGLDHYVPNPFVNETFD